MATVDPSAVAESISAIQRRIRSLAGDRTVHLIAVTKGFGPDAITAAVDAGCSMVGESYAQELVAKFGELGEMVHRPAVHFIGQLQTNKVRQLVGIVDVWQSVDRSSLIDEIARRAPAATIMIQVNATGEADKGGCQPEQVAALIAHARSHGLMVDGLMTIGPTTQDPVATAAAFAAVRALVDEHGLASCSMGMSDDMDVAIDLGATHVRIGSAVFGQRPQPRASIG